MIEMHLFAILLLREELGGKSQYIVAGMSGALLRHRRRQKSSSNCFIDDAGGHSTGWGEGGWSALAPFALVDSFLLYF